jgi:hypothetical protein
MGTRHVKFCMEMDHGLNVFKLKREVFSACQCWRTWWTYGTLSNLIISAFMKFFHLVEMLFGRGHADMLICHRFSCWLLELMSVRIIHRNGSQNCYNYQFDVSAGRAVYRHTDTGYLNANIYCRLFCLEHITNWTVFCVAVSWRLTLPLNWLIDLSFIE